MLIDANVLVYAVDSESPQHDVAVEFLETALNGHRRVALPWQSLTAFLRLTTHPRVSLRPLTATEAWSFVAAWLAADPVWIPESTRRTASILGDLVGRRGVTGNLIPDAALAALAVEHGLTVVTNDADFARFDVPVLNPFAG